MQAKQAWGYIVESVKNDLGEEVSQILDSAVFLSLQGSLFTLAVPDQKTKDAFEEKCRREIVRRLQGYFGTTLDVSIIVDSSITTEAFPKTNEPLIEIETVEDEQTLYEILVNPKRVVVIPDYFRYWIAYLGPDLAWVYVAFRQIAYLASGGKTQGDKTIRTSASRLAQLCGVSDRALFKRFAKPETWKMLHGLVEKIGNNTERYSGSAGRYKVNLSLPLIPAHTAAVKQALELLASTPFDEFVDLVKQISLEDLEDRFSSENSEPPQSVRQIVDQVCTQFNRRDKEIVISVLQESLMPSSRVLIFSHFLMEQVMPAMGPGQTWLYILLRNRSWATSGKGEVTIPGGYAELAKWLGLSRPMTVYEWVNAKPGLLWAYMTPRSKEETKTSHATGEWLSSARTFRVLHTDIPLELLRVPVDQLCASEISSFGVLDGKDSSDDLRKVQRLLTQSSEVTYAKFIGRLREVQRLLTQSSEVAYAKFRGDLRKVQRLLTQSSDVKSLKYGLSSLSLVEEETCSAKNSESFVSDSVGSPEQVSIKNHFELSWSFLDDSVVNPKTRQKLRESGLPAWMFLSWYLYAVSQHSISNPVSFAVRKTLTERKGAGGKWDDLAKSPEILLEHESKMKTLFSGSTARITGNFLR